MIDLLTSAFVNYVNKLSIWTAYFIFCLAWFFSEMLAVPHAHQLKNENKMNFRSNKLKNT